MLLGTLAALHPAEEEDDEDDEVEEDELGTAAGRLFLRPFIRSFREILGFPVQAMPPQGECKCRSDIESEIQLENGF